MLLGRILDRRVLRSDLIDERVRCALERSDALCVIAAAMALSIDPDASSTRTISSGVVAVSDRLEVDDNAVSAVRKSAPFSFDMVTPFLLISPSDTVLSVQIRPTLDVSLLISPDQSQMVEGSRDGGLVTAVRCRRRVFRERRAAEQRRQRKHQHGG